MVLKINRSLHAYKNSIMIFRFEFKLKMYVVIIINLYNCDSILGLL